MDPIKLSHHLQDALVDYLQTTFAVNRDGREPELEQTLARSFQTPGALFNGPYLELTPPYRTGATLKQLCTEGVLTARLLEMSCFQDGEPIPPDAPLYTHQEQAIRKLCAEGRSVVVSSGTGSGKTESFLIPILNDLLLDDTPGVRALLIYPMNALVNDQLDRLRRLLRETSVTFGRYTSELAYTTDEALKKLDDSPLPNEVISREQIHTREKLPQILITNYAMLEYLLLRPEDSLLFQTGLWRFIVLDEAHTYAGAQGIEVAHLIRRLKHRLGKVEGETLCIATSATLAADNEHEARAPAARFAHTLFGELFSEEDIIFGEVDREYAPEVKTLYDVSAQIYSNEEIDVLLEEIRHSQDTRVIAERMYALGLIPDDVRQEAVNFPGNPQKFLWHALSDNPHLYALREWMLEQSGEPVAVEEAAAHIFGELPEDKAQQALYRLIELGVLAREAVDKPPLLPARYHLFARSPKGVWVCLNPDCPGRESPPDAGWSRLFSIPHERCDNCGSYVYPLAICRTCGQVYVRMEEHDHRFLPEADKLVGGTATRYFTWRAVQEDLALSDEEDEGDKAKTAEGQDAKDTRNLSQSGLRQKEKAICLSCGQNARDCHCENPIHRKLYLVVGPAPKQRNKRTTVTSPESPPVTLLEQCVRCRGKAQRGTEVATPLQIGGMAPLSVLTYELYRELPPSPNEGVRRKPGAGRKLLTFYDNRQGAARFAAFLQDTINQNIYRHIIPRAVKILQEQHGWSPDFESVSAKSLDLAWETRVFHSDPRYAELCGKRRPSRSERQRLLTQMQTAILAEFTTGQRRRQSIEGLGLVAANYFDDETMPNFLILAERIDLSPEQSRALVEYLLDTLRYAKVIQLPEGVDPKDNAFGRNRSNPVVVFSKANAQYGEVPWFGQTPLHHRRALVRKVLENLGYHANEHDIERVMREIWDWLIEETDVFNRQGGGAYRIASNRLFFDAKARWYRCIQCQRLSNRGPYLVCSYRHCHGYLEAIPDLYEAQKHNFFFRSFARDLIPVRVEEHTAQLDSEKGREYQEAFRDGDINILSCSTTFEMGIDLGGLQAVTLNNVPPTVANYRQRAGRAGRRASGTAFILTWASKRPHDQTFFSDPPAIIRGHVRPPLLVLKNSIIRQRHVNAILFSEFLRYRRKAGHEAKALRTVGAFFGIPDADDEIGHHAHLAHWLDLRHDEINALLERFAKMIGVRAEEHIEAWKQVFLRKMEDVAEQYRDVYGYYQAEIDGAKDTRDREERKNARQLRNYYEDLQDRLVDERLINYLSDKGVLPSYSFPLHVVELQLPPGKRDAHLRLQRDVRQAIREYAPGSEVVADKRIWRSGGLIFYQGTPKFSEYRICETCNYLDVAPDAGIQLHDGQCPVCGTPWPKKIGKGRRVSQFIEPDGFKAAPESGKPAGQYVQIDQPLMRTALVPQQSPDSGEESLAGLVYFAHERPGKLFHVNERGGRTGFRICDQCGTSVSLNTRKCPGIYHGKSCGSTKFKTVALGHIEETELLHLRFSGEFTPAPDDISFWLSLTYALLQGASQSLQIERRDLGGVINPRSLPDGDWWEQTVVLFDAVPGGAGHARRIGEELYYTLEAAQRVVHCVECASDTSCYHCLRDYSNQLYHTRLKRGLVVRFLDQLLPMLQPLATAWPGEHVVRTTSLARWLLQQVSEVRDEVWLAATTLTEAAPYGEVRGWLDVLGDLVRRKTEVHLCLTQEPEDQDTFRKLQKLNEGGLQIHPITILPPWQVIIDAHNPENCRAIRWQEESPFVLGASLAMGSLTSTIWMEDVRKAQQLFRV